MTDGDLGCQSWAPLPAHFFGAGTPKVFQKTKSPEQSLILIFWFSRTKSCTKCNTYRYPNWFICGDIKCCPYRCANTNPSSSSHIHFFFFKAWWSNEHNTVYK